RTGRRTEREVSLGAAVRRYRHLHRLLFASCTAFSPRHNCVRAWRNTRDLIRTGIVTHFEERGLHDADVSLHPRMLIALNRNQHFCPRERLLDWRRTVGLRLVPLLIQLRCGMDVV